MEEAAEDKGDEEEGYEAEDEGSFQRRILNRGRRRTGNSTVQLLLPPYMLCTTSREIEAAAAREIRRQVREVTEAEIMSEYRESLKKIQADN